MQKVIFKDLGLIDYKVAWDLQEEYFHEIIERKMYNRSHPPEQHFPPKHYLLFCQHPHVYTLGKSGAEQHLLIDKKTLSAKNASFYKIDRGGDITYHGPGQLVGYPILDLDCFFTDIHKYLRFLEEAIIQLLADYGIDAGRAPGQTGVWIEPEDKMKARKIAAMGVRCSRWVTMHGFAFNVNTDLEYFNNIVPCGISDKAVTSLSKELNRPIDFTTVQEQLKKHLSTIFNMQLEQY
jgi:lipoyl(octanoyl) transferase